MAKQTNKIKKENPKTNYEIINVFIKTKIKNRVFFGVAFLFLSSFSVVTYFYNHYSQLPS